LKLLSARKKIRCRMCGGKGYVPNADRGNNKPPELVCPSCHSSGEEWVETN